MKLKLQTGRYRRWKLLGFEWVPDQLGGLMVASMTVCNVSLVLLGTAA